MPDHFFESAEQIQLSWNRFKVVVKYSEIIACQINFDLFQRVAGRNGHIFPHAVLHAVVVFLQGAIALKF